MMILKNETTKFSALFIAIGFLTLGLFFMIGCETEPKGGTLAGAGIGGLALAAAGSSPQGMLLLGATGALAGGVIGNQFIDKPAAEKHYNTQVQLAADQARAAETAKIQTQRDLEEKRLYEEWKRQRAIGISTSMPRVG